MPKKVLVVDDSIGGGTSIKDARRKLDTIFDKGYDFIFCVPIVTPRKRSAVIPKNKDTSTRVKPSLFFILKL